MLTECIYLCMRIAVAIESLRKPLSAVTILKKSKLGILVPLLCLLQYNSYCSWFLTWISQKSEHEIPKPLTLEIPPDLSPVIGEPKLRADVKIVSEKPSLRTTFL